MGSDSSGKTRQLWPLYLAAYTLWLCFSALGVWLIFVLRAVVVGLAFVLQLDPWQVRAVDNFGFVTLGLIWLVGILMLEYYLRRGVEKNRLWGRAIRAFVCEAVGLGLGYVVQALIA